MKKLLLSALAVSVMFVSCGKKENKEPQPKKDFSVAFADINDIHKNMYEKSSAELLKVFGNFKSEVASVSHADFTGWIQDIKPEGSASKGKAGKLGKRYLTSKGIENGQLVKKGLIGAFQLSKALEYGSKFRQELNKEQQEEALKGFATALLGDYASIDNSKVKIASHGKETMGYPVKAGNEFAKYVNVVDATKGFEGISDELYNALKEAKKNLGNSKVVGGNVMKALATAQKIVAIRGAHYLKDAAKLDGDNLSDGVAHGISEGLGFVYSLQFTYNPKNHQPYFSRAEIMNILDNLDLWNGDASAKALEPLAKKVAEKFGFDLLKA